MSLYQANNEVETVGDRKVRPFAVCIMVVGALSMGYIGSIFDPNVTDLSSLFEILTLVSLVITGAAIGMFLFEYRESAFERHGDALCSERLLLVVAFCVVGVAGFFVNPVQQGLGAIRESSQSAAIQEIVKDDSLGKWVSLASAHTGQLLIANGAPTINSVNVYPDLDRWAQVDKRGNYVDVYNRYAHITVMLQELRPTSFELSSADAFTLYLDPLDLETLEVRYIYSEVELNDIAYLSNKLTLLKSGNGWFIYEYLN